MNGSLWLCGYEIISNNRFAKVIKLDSNGIITDSNTSNSTSEYTAIINYSGNILLSKSNLTVTSSTSNELSSYLGGNIFGPSISLNSGSPFVPYDLVIDQNYVYCIGVQGENHYVGIPAIQKLRIESVETLGLEDEHLFAISIYPNPTNNTLFISGNETPIAVAIYNVLGKEVLSIKNTNNINVQALQSGVYVIRISDGVGQTNRKFIKN